MTKVVKSEGQRLLMELPGSLATIAEEMGAKSPQVVHNWRNGYKVPNAAARAALQDVFGIPTRAWAIGPLRPGGALPPAPPPLLSVVPRCSCDPRTWPHGHTDACELRPPPAASLKLDLPGDWNRPDGCEPHSGPPLRPSAVTPVATAGTVPAPWPAAISGGGEAPSSLAECMALLASLRSDREQPGLLAAEKIKLATAEAKLLTLRARLEADAQFTEASYVTKHPSWIRLKRAILKALMQHPIAARAVAEAMASVDGAGG